MLRRLVAACLALALAVALVAPTPGAAAEERAPSSGDSWSHDLGARTDRELADPAALTAVGEVHVYGTSALHCTGNGCGTIRVPRFHGRSLRHPGTLAGDALPDRPDWVSPLDPDIWAPSVVRIGDRYTMYFAATADTGPAAGMKCLGLAHASSPEGPFVAEGRPLRGTPGFWNIDPFAIEDGGRWFLLWREDDAAHVTGKVVAAELSADGSAVAEPPRTLVAGAHSWEDGYPSGARDDGSRNVATDQPAVGARRLPDSALAAGQAGTGGIGPVENPAMARHPATGEWLLTWSANRWETQDYATGLAVCDGPLGPCRRISDTAPWLRRSGDPGIDTGARFGGSGGMDLVAAEGELYAVFHAYRGDGQHPAQPRVAWAYRVVADGPGRYRLAEP